VDFIIQTTFGQVQVLVCCNIWCACAGSQWPGFAVCVSMWGLLCCIVMRAPGRMDGTKQWNHFDKSCKKKAFFH